MAQESQTQQKQWGISDVPGAQSNNDTDGLLSASFQKWATILFLGYFGIRLVFFALSLSPSVPPDEVTHAGLCKVFSNVFLLPDNSPETYEFGLVTNTPWLYYWIMGKLLHLNFFGISDLTFLRLLNIPLAFGTVFFVWRLLRLLTNDRLTQLTLIAVITNIPMFSLLSASVSYDNLTNLLAAMAIYYLLAFFKFRSGNLLVASFLAQLAGCLTKITFLPLVIALNALLFIHLLLNLRTIPSALKGYSLASGRRAWLPVPVLLLGLLLNLQLYAGNYLHFGTPSPAMTDVVSPEKAMENRIWARETIFRMYTEGKISYMEALVKAGEIKHPGDKSDTFFLLMNYENLKQNPALWMGLPQYVRVWFATMVGTICGIKAHLIMAKEGRLVFPFYLLMLLASLGFLVRWRPRESGWLPVSLAAIIMFYAGYIMYKVNYSSYLYYGTPGPTLQGRYLFPVIGAICVLSCHYLLSLFRANRIRVVLALATALLFIMYDFPWFLAHATPEWYA